MNIEKWLDTEPIEKMRDFNQFIDDPSIEWATMATPPTTTTGIRNPALDSGLSMFVCPECKWVWEEYYYQRTCWAYLEDFPRRGKESKTCPNCKG